MKKMIVLVCIAFIASVQVKAQWSVTPEVGIAAVHRNDLMSDDWIIGTKSGVGLGYQFNQTLGLKSGLYYALRGLSLDGFYEPSGEYHPANSKVNLRRHFLQIPFLFNYSRPLNKDVVLNLAVGPYIAFSVKDYCNESTFIETYMPDELDCRTFDWGVSASAGVEIKKKWIINLNYDLSLGKEAANDGLNANYHTVSLSAGYKFSFK